MKYLIKNSDIMLNGKIIPEGSEVELSEEQTKGLEEYLIQCHSALDAESIAVSEEKELKTKSKGNKK